MYIYHIGGTMNNLIYKFKQYLLRINKNDQLNFMLLSISIIITFSNYFIFENLPLSILTQFMLIVVIYRFFSRNKWQREKENRLFLNNTKFIRNQITLVKLSIKDKDHKYFICPKCKKFTRVPKGKGKIEIKCPYCKHCFDKKS